MRILRLIWSPDLEFRHISQRPSIGYYFTALVIGSYLVSLATAPFTEQAAIAQLGATVGEMEAARIVKANSEWRLLGLVVSPLFLMAKFVCYASLAWALAVIANRWMEFRKTLTVVMAASLALTSKGMIMGVVLHLRRLYSNDIITNLNVPLGLDLIFTEQSAFASSLLGNINVFEAWYVTLLIIGFRTTCKLSPKICFPAAGTVWGIGILAEAELQSVAEKFQQTFF